VAGNIFINYRREESADVAGRLYDALAQRFGHNKIFMDVDNIPAGSVAACDAMLAIIDSSWLNEKDETGRRRLDNPDDFAIEIEAALARKISVVPVLVDGARMPKVRWLPDPLKPLARCQAVEVHQRHFDQDAEAVIQTVREALNGDSVVRRSRRGTAAASVVTGAGLLLVGWVWLSWMQISVWPPWADTRAVNDTKLQAEAEAQRRSEQAEQQRLTTLKAERELQARAAAEAEAKRESGEAEQQRLVALRSEEEERKRAEDQARAHYAALIDQGNTDSNAGAYDKAIASFNEAIRLDPTSTLGFRSRGAAYANKDDYDRAIADFNEAIRLDPKSALAFSDRGVAYANKDDYDRAIADFNQAIRLDRKSALAFRNRGDAFANKDDYDRAIADYNEAVRLDPKNALAFRSRGVAYAYKGDDDQAISDYSEAIRLDPKNSLALSYRGVGYANKGDHSRAIADFNQAIRLDPKNALAFCNRGKSKRTIKDSSADADIAKSRELGAVCQ
jgi:tetratricopeptide (TPR) repeat protein